MPRFEPFAGLRYSPSHISSLAHVMCPPYDVIAEEERRGLLALSPENAVSLELPREGVGGGDRYVAARRLLDSWRDGGVLVRDRIPAFYGYRMTYIDPAGVKQQTVGAIGALGLEPPGAGILPHEHTTPKAKTDRLELLRATRTNMSPIWALTPNTGLAKLCNPPAHAAERARDEQGVTHEMWPITDASAVKQIGELVGRTPVLVADGHHRYEVALKYQAEQGGREGDHNAVMALVVELSDEQLSVQAIHRVIRGLPASFDFPAAISRHFDLAPTDPVDATIGSRMTKAGGLTVVTKSGTWLAVPRQETSIAADHDLDSSRLEVALRHLPDHKLVYQHGWDLAAGAVRSGEANAAVLLRPATVSQIADISEGGKRMPPKTTFFWPKPRTGLVFRELVS